MTEDEIAATLALYGWIPQIAYAGNAELNYSWVGWAHRERNSGMGMLVYFDRGHCIRRTEREWAFCYCEPVGIVRTKFTPHHAVTLRRIYDYMVNEGVL